MPTNHVQKFQDITLLQHFLNGGIIGSEMPKNQPPAAPGWYNITGLTLIFTSPSAATVTFINSSSPNYPPTLLQFADVKAQIQAALATVNVIAVGGRFAIIENTPTSGVAISAAGTSNGRFGFDVANPTAGKVLVPPGVTPGGGQGQWTWAYSVNENYHTLYYWY
jgi:hypothetical protein